MTQPAKPKPAPKPTPHPTPELATLGTTSIANNGRVCFGFGALAEIADGMGEFNLRRPLVCSDPGLRRAGLLQRLLDALPGDAAVSVYADTPANPTEAAVNDAAAHYRAQQCDGVIAFGGGSSLDLGKAVALRATHRGPLEIFATHRGGAGKIGEVAPLIAVPTTAGTGSEVARACVLILDNGEKRIIASPRLVPRLSILDPDLTLGLPPLLTAATGMDAVTHCIEAVLSPVVNPPAEAIALDGIERAVAAGNLLRAVAKGDDREARWNMLLVSTEGAMAFSKGLGAVHAMSHACGKNRRLALHHGTLNAVLLPPVLAFNRDHAGRKYPRIARAMGLAPEADLAAAVAGLNARLGLPRGLAALGVRAEMIPDLAAHAADDLCAATNPVVLDQRGYRRLFSLALGMDADE